MLYYVGKDLERWVEQCAEMSGRDDVLRAAGITAASFVQYLVDDPPSNVREKLVRWGVADYKSIFSRALGLNGVFSRVPELDWLSPHFVRYYYRYADQMFTCRQGADSFPRLPAQNFVLDLYASGEYSRLLEREWEEI